MQYLYQNKNKKELNLFRDVGFFKQYSKCAQKLDMLYKNNSFKNFYNKMKHSSKVIQLGSKDKIYEQKEKKFFDFDWFVKYLNKGTSHSSNVSLDKDNNEYNKYSSSYSETVNQRVLENVQKIRHKRELQLLEEPSIGRYSPNYNAIRKKIPVIDFSKELSRRDTLLEKIKLKQQNENEPNNINKNRRYRQLSLDDLKSSHYKLPPLLKQSHDDNSNNNINKLNNIISPISENPNKKNFTLGNNLSKGKMVFCKSQSQYKLPIKKIIKKQLNSKLIKTIDFNPHKGKKIKTQDDLKNDTPCIGLYQPKYEYITKNSPNILFDTKLNKKKGKRYLLQKLWNSYNISLDYQLVNIK